MWSGGGGGERELKKKGEVIKKIYQETKLEWLRSCFASVSDKAAAAETTTALVVAAVT